MSTRDRPAPGTVPWGAVGLAAAGALFLLCASGNFAVSDTLDAPGYAKAGFALTIAGCALGFALTAASGVVGRGDEGRRRSVLRLQLIAVGVLVAGWVLGVVYAAIGAATAGELADGKWAPVLPIGLIPLLVLLVVGRHIRRRIGLPRPSARPLP